MVYAHDAGSQIRLAGPVASAYKKVLRSITQRRAGNMGSCTAGCWLERDASGNEYCYCPDASMRGVGEADTGTGRALTLLAVLGVAAAGLAVYNRVRR